MKRAVPGSLSERARAGISSGELRGDALLAFLSSVPPEEREAVLDAALGLPPPPPDVALPRGAVPYLPSSTSAIVTATREAPVTSRDVFVDIGSGLGRAAILAHLFTGARAIGIEIQRHLVEGARALCRALGIEGVSFVEGDAADPDVPLDGDVFYLYAPFNGPMRARVLGRLEAVAAKRPFVVCAVDFDLDDQRWLARRASSSLEVTFYQPRSARRAAPRIR